MSFNQKQSPEYESHLDRFLSVEYQINRKNYEKYLGSLKNHIHAHLFKIENRKQEVAENPFLALPGTQKGAFVVDLAQKFWKETPLGKQGEAYEYYQAHCPFHKLLKRDRWDQIVRDRGLDPRPPKEKRRSCGKKARKN